MKTLSWEKFNEEEELEDETQLRGLMLTPISMGPNVNDYDDFNFFIGHCNFYVNSEIVNYLCTVEGVEALDILSPYRFRVAVGKLFAADEVLEIIKTQLTKE